MILNSLMYEARETLKVQESSISSTLMIPSIFRACWMFAPCAPEHFIFSPKTMHIGCTIVHVYGTEAKCHGDPIFSRMGTQKVHVRGPTWLQWYMGTHRIESQPFFLQNQKNFHLWQDP